MDFIAKITAFITAAVMFLMPCYNYSPKQEDVKLNVALLSDTHIDARLPLGKYLLKRALKDMKANTLKNDAVVVTGDLTNYGDEDSIKDFFDILTTADRGGATTAVLAMGNHEIGHTSDLGMTNLQAREMFLRYQNEYLRTSFENNYYSFDVKGYKFVVLCDDSADSWDQFEIGDEQIAFLDEELAEGTAEGLPAFVVCHEPVENVNGQSLVWDDGAMDSVSSKKIKTVLEKYDNVFYVSGHMHEGINGALTETMLGFCCVETIDGVTYVSLPSYLLVNRYGIPWNGLGMQMEVYEQSVIFRARSYMTSKWYSAYEYQVPLVSRAVEQ